MATNPGAAEATPARGVRFIEYGTIASAVLGLGLRLFHYLRCPSVWHDEAALLVNVLDKNLSELLGPLYWAEAAPTLYLWLERATGLLLGTGVMALRLPVFLASCLALLLFFHVARSLLAPTGACVAVLLFATSDTLLWHTCEAKPYAVDVFLAIGTLWLHLRMRGWSPITRCSVQALLSPALIFPSYGLCGITGRKEAWCAETAGCMFITSVIPAVVSHCSRPRSCRTQIDCNESRAPRTSCAGLDVAGSCSPGIPRKRKRRTRSGSPRNAS